MTQQSARVVSLQSVQKSSKVILVEPRVYAEAQDISEHLKNKRAVVVNLQRIDRDQGIRIVDFLKRHRLCARWRHSANWHRYLSLCTGKCRSCRCNLPITFEQ